MQKRLCDICFYQDHQLTESTRYSTVKHQPGLRLDLCDLHAGSHRPKSGVEHLKFVYKLKTDTSIDDDMARQMLMSARMDLH